MHRLLRLLPIALCCLACTEERKNGVLEVQAHELRDCELAITKGKAGFERSIGAVFTAAGEMEDGGLRKTLYHGSDSRPICALTSVAQYGCWYIRKNPCNIGRLLGGIWQSGCLGCYK